MTNEKTKLSSISLIKFLLLLFALTLLPSCSRQTQNQLVISVQPIEAGKELMTAEAAAAVRQSVVGALMQNSKKSRFIVIDGGHQERIIEQHHFEAGPWSDSNKVAEFDKELNAQIIAVLGVSAGSSSSRVTVSVILLNVNTMELHGRTEAEISGVNTGNPDINRLTSAVKNMRIKL